MTEAVVPTLAEDLRAARGMTNARATILAGLKDGSWHRWDDFHSAPTRKLRFGEKPRGLPWRATGQALVDAGWVESARDPFNRIIIRLTDAGRAKAEEAR